MNTGFRVLAGLVLAGLLAVVGVAVYNAGVDQGLAQNITATASGAPVAGYGYPGYIGPHWGWGWGGFGLFGIFFWILGILLVFALLRAMFGWGRWGRHHGSWSGYGPGYGPGDGPGYGPGDRRREMFDSWHRDAHQGSGGSGSAGSGSGPASSAG